MGELHGNERLAREAFHRPRLPVHLDAGELHVDLGLDEVPLVVVERHGRMQRHVEDAVAHHEHERQVLGRWPGGKRAGGREKRRW